MPGRAPTIHIREADADELLAGPRDDPAREPRRRVWVAERGTERVASLVAELHDLVLDRREVPSARIELAGDLGSAAPWPELAASARASLADAGVGYLYRLAPPAPKLRRALGLTVIGRYLQRAKALRPLSLLAARLHHPPGLDRVGKVLDPLLGLPLRAPGWRPRQLVRGNSFVELTLADDAPALVALLTRAARGGVGRRWTAAELITAYGSEATVIAQTHAGTIVAFVAMRIEDRAGLRTATILDIVARDDEFDLHAELLRAAERRVRERAEVLTLLDGASGELRKAARRAGFIDTGQRWVLGVDRLDPTLAPLPPGARWRLGLVDTVEGG